MKAILDLAYELSVEHGYSYIDFCVVDGRGVANTRLDDADPIHIFEDYMQKPQELQLPGDQGNY